jgi:hypothetical protein
MAGMNSFIIWSYIVCTLSLRIRLRSNQRFALPQIQGRVP